MRVTTSGTALPSLTKAATIQSTTYSEKGDLVPKQLLDKISIYVPKSKIGQKPVERLLKLAAKKDRSVNYLVVEAILEFLKREEKKG